VKQAKEKTIKMRKELRKENLLMLVIYCLKLPGKFTGLFKNKCILSLPRSFN